MMPVIKVSALSCRLRFIACGPQCIAKGCTSRCCDAPSTDLGIMVSVHDSEVRGLKAHGAKVTGGMLQPRPGERLCPFKTPEHLCGLWQKPERPLGCIVSPFMLNPKGTLIIRNRYKMLPSYDPVNGEPAYRVFSASVVAMFGEDQAKALVEHLDKGGGNMELSMPAHVYEVMTWREGNLHATRAGPSK
jgi:hypothetical protein